MNKKDFKKYIEENISGLSLERQIKELQKIQNVYLTEFINLRKKKEGTWIQDKDKDKYIFCSKCQKYYLKSKWKEEYVREVREVTTYIDQTTPNMIQGLKGIFARKPLISRGI